MLSKATSAMAPTHIQTHLDGCAPKHNSCGGQKPSWMPDSVVAHTMGSRSCDWIAAARPHHALRERGWGLNGQVVVSAVGQLPTAFTAYCPLALMVRALHCQRFVPLFGPLGPAPCTLRPAGPFSLRAPEVEAYILVSGHCWSACAAAGPTWCTKGGGSIMVGHRYWMPPPRQFQPMFQVLSTINCYATSSR